jgi:hypothetical protein
MSRRQRSSNSTASRRSAPAATVEAPLPPTRRQQVFVAIALLAGLIFCLLAGNDMPLVRWIVVLAAVAISLVPRVTGVLLLSLDRLRHPSKRMMEWTGVMVGVVATAYLIFTAFLQERPLAPRMIDENSYALSAQMLAHGRLWMPQHPLADFFDSFFVVVRPQYSSIYFPGTGLAFAPSVWLNSGTWILPVVFAGLCVGLLYRIVTDLTRDGVAGLLAAVWMLAMMPFRAVSVMMMSQIVMLTLGLLLVWAWLRWRENKHWKWAIAIGAFAGWAAITRPVDAIAYALPVGVAMIAGLRGGSWRQWVKNGAAIVLAAAPFLSLQVAHNIAITGDAFHTPYAAYLEREQPGAQYGVRRYDPAWQPASSSLQMRDYYNWCRPFLEHHQPDNFLKPWFFSTQLTPRSIQPPHLLTAAENSMPSQLLLLLIPAGLVAAFADRRRLVLAATLVAFLLLYTLNPFFLPHYLVVVTPAVILLAILGGSEIARAAGNRFGATVRVGLAIAVLMISVTALWEVKWLLAGERPGSDGFRESAPISAVEAKMNAKLELPAVVLFGKPPDPWSEMVYNIDAPWPDDSPIIRAHDLGERNVEIIDYYAQHQPDRKFYRFIWNDKGDGSMQRIGPGMNAADLSRLLHSGALQSRQ